MQNDERPSQSVGLTGIGGKVISARRTFAFSTLVLSNSLAAFVIAVAMLTEILALASLIFSGPLQEGLYRGTGFLLIGALISGLLLPAFSSLKSMSAGPRSAQMLIFASMTSGLAGSMAGSTAQEKVTTSLAMMLIATLVVGLIMLAFGIMRWGRLIRFLPYPVMAGFFSGIGILLFVGGFEVSITNHTPSASGLISQSVLIQGGSGLFLGLFLIAIEHRFRHRLAFPIVFVVALLIFNFVIWIFDLPADDYAVIHATQGISGIDSFIPDLKSFSFSDISWMQMLHQSGSIAVLAALSIITLLLEISGIEVAINREIDPNRELRGAGLANIAGAFLGAPLSGPSSADTIHAFKVGGGNPIFLAFYSAFILGVLFIGPKPLVHIPAALMGGVLIFSAYALLKEWVWKPRKRLPWLELVGIIAIAVTFAYYGILVGVAVGFGLATLLFVHSYSRLAFIRSSLKGSEFSGNIDRHVSEQAFLDQHGDTIRIIQLQGFLFFGSAYRLLEEVKKVHSRIISGSMQFLIIDFERVDAIDSSAISSLIKLLQYCDREEIKPIFADCKVHIKHSLNTMINDYKNNEIADVKFMPDVEAAHGHCCDEILSTNPNHLADEFSTCEDLLASLLPSKDMAKQLAPRFETVHVRAREMIFAEGDPGDALYFIGSGSVSIQLRRESEKVHILRTIRAGAIFGEMALYTGAKRSADAIAVQDTELHRLTKENYENFAQDVPIAASEFHRFVVRIVSERVSRMNREIMAIRR